MEFLFLIKKQTDTLIEQTNWKPQETPEIELHKQKETFSFPPPINLVEVGKWMIAVVSFEATNSVFNITDESNSFSNSTPNYWTPEDGEELINKLNRLLEFRSETISNYM